MSTNHITASVVQEVQEAKPHKFLGVGKYREKHQRQCFIINVGTNDTTRGNLDNIKSDYRALNAAIKVMEAQLVSSSILSVRRKGRGGRH